MPELPEVETIARQLRELVVGRRIAAFESFWHRVTEPVPAAHFATRLVGRQITGVGRRGKFVVLELDGDEALIVSLRMTGKLLFREPGAPDDTFVRAVIEFADGTGLRFSDTRKFGRMAIVDRADLVENGDRPRSRAGVPLHRVLGIEPLTPRFTTRWLRDFLQLRGRSAIKPLLLDQRGIAGVGNIYAIEALWRARIHPLRTAGSLRPDEVDSRRAEPVGDRRRSGEANALRSLTELVRAQDLKALRVDDNHRGWAIGELATSREQDTAACVDSDRPVQGCDATRSEDAPLEIGRASC